MDDTAGVPYPHKNSPATPTGRDVHFVPRATAKDVYYCFRLFFGRYPHPEEWRGHAARAGEDLRGVVRSFANSLECTRAGMLASPDVTNAHASRFQGVIVYTADDDVSIGQAVRDGNYEPEICSLFRSVLRPGMNVLDLGANIGVLTLLAAHLVGPSGTVIAVEPNPRNVRLLEASRRANAFNNVTVLQIAAGRENGLLVLNTSYSNGTTSGLPKDEAALMSAETVPAFRLDAVLPHGRLIDLIKVDVEGAEYNALQGCRETIANHRPAIISEFSPSLMPGISGINGEDYLRWLISFGYDLSVVNLDGTLLRAGADTSAIMRTYDARMVDHIDILAEPKPAGLTNSHR